jgi:hypothetical protein
VVIGFPQTDAIAVGNWVLVSDWLACVVDALLDREIRERRERTTVPRRLVESHRVIAEVAESSRRASALGNGAGARGSGSSHSGRAYLMSVQEVAAEMNRTSRRVRQLARTGELAPERTRPYMFHAEKVNAYMRHRGMR